MPTLLNPSHTAAFDASRGKIILTLRDGRDASVAELDPVQAPALINALMSSVHAAKMARKVARGPAPPTPEPARVPPPRDLTLADVRAIRADSPSVIGTRGPRGGRVRRS